MDKEKLHNGPVIETDPQKLAQTREFNKLVGDHYRVWIKQGKEFTGPLRAKMAAVISSQGDEASQHAFLWQTIRQRIIDNSQQALEVLNSEKVKLFYGVGRNPLSKEEYEQFAKSDPRVLFDIVHSLKSTYGGIALDFFSPDENEFTYPYDKLRPQDNLDLVRVCANVGHDFNKIPGFSYLVNDLAYTLGKNPDWATKKIFVSRNRFALDNISFLHQGLVWMFEAYRNMAQEYFPQKDAVDLNAILTVAASEAAARAYNDHELLEFVFSEKKYIDQTEKERELVNEGIIGWEPYQNRFEIKTKIGSELKLKGNEAGLHLLLYQFWKNSVRLLSSPVHEINDAIISLDVQSCRVTNQDLIAVRYVDNGPGLDFAGILRAKQKLLKTPDEPLTSKELMIAGDWACLDLRVLDIVNFIFERRVSALDRRNSPHSGIGLALAKEIVDQHGGSIWATNLSGEFGAKFMLLFDPSSDGSLRRNIPDLFQTEKVPTGILNDIDSQLDNK